MYTLPNKDFLPSFLPSVERQLFNELGPSYLGGAVAEWRGRGGRVQGARWPSGLERWLVQATGLSWPGSNPTAENFASELWQFRLPRFASVFRRRH